MKISAAAFAIVLFSSGAQGAAPPWARADFRVQACREHLSGSRRLARKRFERSQGGVPQDLLELDSFLPRYKDFLERLNWQSSNGLTVDEKIWTGRISSDDRAYHTRASLNVRMERGKKFVKIALSIRRPTSAVGDFDEQRLLESVMEDLFTARETKRANAIMTHVKGDTIFTIEIDFLPVSQTTFLNFQSLLGRLGFQQRSDAI